MAIKTSYCSPISVFLILVIMMLVASAQDIQSSAARFDPDYPVGTPPILGGTGYVTKTDSNGWHTVINYGQECLDAECKGVNGLYHAGEDWNYGSGSDELTAENKKPAHVYAIAGGTVVDKRDEIWPGKNRGSGIVIEHTLPTGEKIYSVYVHIDIRSGLKIGDSIKQGDAIGTIRDISSSGLSPHLHFEIRTKWIDPIDYYRSTSMTVDASKIGVPKGQDSIPVAVDASKIGVRDWWPHDFSDTGYYSTLEDLRADGLVDPSDFIDYYRTTPVAVAAAKKGVPELVSRSYPVIASDEPAYTSQIPVGDTQTKYFSSDNLPPEKVQLSLDIRNENGNIVPVGTKVTVKDGSGNYVQVDWDSTGHTVASGAPGNWVITVDAPGYKTNTQYVTVSRGSSGTSFRMNLLKEGINIQPPPVSSPTIYQQPATQSIPKDLPKNELLTSLGLGTPLLSPPTSGMLSGEGNAEPDVQSASSVQGTSNGIIGKWNTVLNVHTGGYPGYPDHLVPVDFVTNFNADGTVNIPKANYKTDGIEFSIQSWTGTWTQTGDVLSFGSDNKLMKTLLVYNDLGQVIGGWGDQDDHPNFVLVQNGMQWTGGNAANYIQLTDKVGTLGPSVPIVAGVGPL